MCVCVLRGREERERGRRRNRETGRRGDGEMERWRDVELGIWEEGRGERDESCDQKGVAIENSPAKIRNDFKT